MYNRELLQGGQWQTACPGCGGQVVWREGFVKVVSQVGEDGRCPHCQATLAGVYERTAEIQSVTQGAEHG